MFLYDYISLFLGFFRVFFVLFKKLLFGLYIFTCSCLEFLGFFGTFFNIWVIYFLIFLVSF